MPYSLDFARLHALYRDGLDPRQVVAECYARIEAAADPGIFIAIARDGAERAATALGAFDPATKPLWGLPFAIKDNIDLLGVDTTAGCPAFAYRPERTATAVGRLLAAGAIPIGKTNLDQFATGLVGVRTPYPVPRNSFDASIVPGGSSSGSAVAVARGLVSFALGTDTAGSGRVPAGLNNLVGLKPTLGAVPVGGVVPACKSLDCVSVFALTVPDAFAAFRAMAGFDADDPWSKPLDTGAPTRLPRHVRVGVPDRRSRIFFGDATGEHAFDSALDRLVAAGIDIVPVDFEPFFAVAKLLYEGAWVAERYAAIRSFVETRSADMHPTTRRIIAGAARLSAADAFEGFYKLAELRRKTEPVWRSLDALGVPTVPRPFTIADLDADPIGPNSALGTYTNFVNLLDLCALSVPGPFRSDGFPSGLTFIAPAGGDAFLASLGAAFHAAAAVPLGATGLAAPTHAEAPVVSRAGRSDVAAAAEGIELAVVGAHLSGMPLNATLVARGGRLARSAETTPDYRLYALPGGPPARPGLVRVGAAGGAPIAVEVWTLPPEAFGRFVDAVPPPLAIGTIRLDDGSAPKGFLCEAAGLEGAEDITAFGGWRAFARRQDGNR